MVRDRIPLRRYDGVVTRIYTGPFPRPPADRPPFYNEGPYPSGIPVWSLSGTIRGVTLGGRAPCPSKTCNGFLICIDWESGQVTFPCSKGWSHEGNHIRIMAGGEITGRVINPVEPLPRDEWPERPAAWPLTWPKPYR